MKFGYTITFKIAMIKACFHAISHRHRWYFEKKYWPGGDIVYKEVGCDCGKVFHKND